MTTENFLPVDITLSLSLKGFDGKVVRSVKAILVEKGTPLPLIKEKGNFVKDVKVPVNGRAFIRLSADNGGHRVIVEDDFVIKRSLFLIHRVKNIYNATQETLEYIPVVGKIIAKIAPDAEQIVDCVYEIEISSDGIMRYSVLVGRERKPKKSFLFEGELGVS